MAYKEKLMIMKRKNKKDVCLMNSIHDEKLVQIRFETKTLRSPK
jgi:hypothetical protein